MKLVYFTNTMGKKIAIPLDKITGITETEGLGNAFIATGADSPEGGENGWYVSEKYIDICMMLESC